LAYGLVNRGAIKNTGLTANALATIMSNENLDVISDKAMFDDVSTRSDDKIQTIIENQYDQILSDMVGVGREQLFVDAGASLNLSDALKVINNSTYGLLGTVTNPYGSFIVSNSITAAAKVLGLLALQYQCNENYDELVDYVIIDEEDTCVYKQTKQTKQTK
jgi:hypothetical protein